MTDEQAEAVYWQSRCDGEAEHRRQLDLIRGKTPAEAVRALHEYMDAQGVSHSGYGQMAREMTIRACLGELA